MYIYIYTYGKSVGMMKFPTDWNNKTCAKPPTSEWIGVRESL